MPRGKASHAARLRLLCGTPRPDEATLQASPVTARTFQGGDSRGPLSLRELFGSYIKAHFLLGVAGVLYEHKTHIPRSVQNFNRRD